MKIDWPSILAGAAVFAAVILLLTVLDALAR